MHLVSRTHPRFARLASRSTLVTFSASALLFTWTVSTTAAPQAKSEHEREVADLIARVLQSKSTLRRDAVDELIAIGPEALDDVRAARDETKDEEAARALDHAATWIVAREILPILERGIESQLTYDGQYAELADFGKGVSRALVAIVDDSASPFADRIAACRALADLGDKEVLPDLRRLERDVLLPHGLREQLSILLAIFGDRHAIEREIAEYERFAADRVLSVRLAALTQLANLWYRIRDYKKAVGTYEEILSIYEQVLKDQRDAGTPAEFLQAVERELTLHYYNAACSNSLYGDLDRAKEYLRRAVEGDPTHFDNMTADGDLRRLREDPSYEDFRRELGKLFEGKDL